MERMQEDCPGLDLARMNRELEPDVPRGHDDGVAVDDDEADRVADVDDEAGSEERARVDAVRERDEGELGKDVDEGLREGMRAGRDWGEVRGPEGGGREGAGRGERDCRRTG